MPRHSLALALSLLATSVFAATPSVVVQLRDSRTGLAVAGSVVSPSLREAASGKISESHALALEDGIHELAAKAPTHRTLTTKLTATQLFTLPVTMWLDPINTPFELTPEFIGSRLKSDAHFFHGHVTDTSGRPLRGARVEDAEGGLLARSDASGYFSFHLQAPVDTLATTDFRIVHKAFADHEIVRTMLQAGIDTHFLVELKPGNGSTFHDDEHKILLHREGGPHPHDPEDHHSHADDAIATGSPRITGDVSAAAVTVPSSIRVGFNCNCSTCSTVEVFSMETYVKRGLNDEWIASWHGESLRAGAVAYRSFGAWHVANPKSANYDVCSSTCCQVNDADTSSSTDSAATATAGIVLERNNAIFRAEYSSENNAWDDPADSKTCNNVDLSCGNGNAGSPSASWPCLSDTVCSGYGCFGHGRGMCQWGSQRWASTQGKGWRWIVDHYYNDNGKPAGLRSAFLNDSGASTEIIVDNATSGRFTASSNWATSSYSAQRYGADYRYANPQAISDAAWFKASIATAGNYEVFVWYPANSGYNSSTPFIVATSSGNQTITVNQQINGGVWFSLGTFSMTAGDYNAVGVSRWTSGAGYVIADAVRLVKR